MKSDAKPVIAAVEKYKTANGRYPDALAHVGTAIPQPGYGGWRYRSFDAGAKFELSVGNYGDHGFVLSWNSDGGHWYLDQ